MPEQFDRDYARQYLTQLRLTLQEHYRRLTDGQPHHHGPLVERAVVHDYGFDALIVLLPPYAPEYAHVVLDLIEAMSTDSFNAVCEPGGSHKGEVDL